MVTSCNSEARSAGSVMAATGATGKSLSDLPPELIKQIVSHAPRAQFLRNLSLSCKWLHKAVETHGWATFVMNRFPSIETPPYWRDAAHALTTLSRNLDIRACIVEDMNPPDSPPTFRQLPSGKLMKPSRPRTRQTMGYQPVIDSHEEWVGSWDARKEVVVWGAGVDVMARILERQGSAGQHFTETAEEEKRSNFKYDSTGSSNRIWLTYKGDNNLEGRDDVTSINLLKSSYRQDYSGVAGHTSEPAADVVVGRASKKLELIRMWLSGAERVRNYDTQGCNVRGADVSHTDKPLIGACLEDSLVALYAVHGEEKEAEPISKAICDVGANDRSRSWSAKFLCPDKLAVGRGIAHRIVHVYSVRPEGLSKEPIRSFAAKGEEQEAIQTSAYPIVPVPESLGWSEELGTMFFSGGHDGLIRLHDMRAPQDSVGTMADFWARSAVFSMAMVGRERLVAGTQRHRALNVFDLRMAGGRTYPRFKVSTGAMVDGSTMPEVDMLSDTQGCLWMNMQQHNGGRNSRVPYSSPVYSLSRPSASSTSLYVGLENQVGHVNFTDPSDRHPDPVFRQSIVRLADGEIDARRTYTTPGTNTINIFTQSSEGIVFMKQVRSGRAHELHTVRGDSYHGIQQWKR